MELDSLATTTVAQDNGASINPLRSMTPSQPSAASSNINYVINKKPPVPHRPFSDPNHLAPEDAFYAHSPPRRQRQIDDFLGLNGVAAAADSPSIRGNGSVRRRRGKDRGRSGSRRGKNVWKKLLWVKQENCPSCFETCYILGQF